MSEKSPLLMINTERGWRGGENQLAVLVRGLPTDWLTMTVCQPGSPLALELKKHGQPVAEIPMGGGGDLLAAWRIRALAKRVGARALHAHTSHGHALALTATIGWNLPVLVTRRVDFPLKRGFAARWKYGERVRRFIAVSQAVGDVLAAGGIPTERIAVIRDGVDPARLRDAVPTLRQELGLDHAAVLVGCVAHLADHKDHRTLLAAWAQVERSAPHAHLALVGTGELEDELKQLAQDLKLRRVVFTGFRSDVGSVLRSLDVFTLSSHLEGLGSSVQDAMLCGLPVVATRAGGLPELVRDGETGLLVPVRGVDALAQALICMTTSSDLRQRCGRAGLVAADPAFTAARMVAEHVALYEQVLG
jgi:glycosyltransferase involved in cell wall biosynthesis